MRLRSPGVRKIRACTGNVRMPTCTRYNLEGKASTHHNLQLRKGQYLRKFIANDPFSADWKPADPIKCADRIKEIEDILKQPDFNSAAEEYRRMRKLGANLTGIPYIAAHERFPIGLSR
jgi:hypothetical protein